MNGADVVRTLKTSDGCSIAYFLRTSSKREAPRLVLIHSLALDASIWDGVIAKLDGQASVLAYDCRGHGRSERRAGAYTTDLFARDLAELLDHVSWPSAAVAGCSMGGCVAQAFAGLYPARATALGLIDTTAWYGEGAPKTWRDRAGVARSKGFTGMVDFQVSRWFDERFHAASPELVRKTAEVFLANDLDCYAASCILLGDADLRSYLASLRIPVAVIVGEEDYATPVAAARQMHDGIPGSTLKILQGARHLTPIECPEEIASELLALLGRVRTQQAGA